MVHSSISTILQDYSFPLKDSVENRTIFLVVIENSATTNRRETYAGTKKYLRWHRVITEKNMEDLRWCRKDAEQKNGWFNLNNKRKNDEEM